MKKHLFAILAMVCLIMSFSVYAAEDIVWDFDDNTVNGLSISNAGSYSVENGVLRLNLSETKQDLIIYLPANVNTSDYKTVIIDMRHNIPAENMGTNPLEVYFKLEGGSWTWQCMVSTAHASASSTFHRYTVDLSSNSLYTGTLSELRIDPVDTLSVPGSQYYVEIDKVTFVAEETTAETGIIEWNFDNGDRQGWSTANGVDKGVEDGVYKVALSTTKSDTWIQNTSVNFEAASYKYMIFYMRHNLPDGDYGPDNIYGLFVRTQDTPWQAHLLTQISTRYTASQGFMPYIIDMTKCSYWNGTIKALRIDPFEKKSTSDTEYYFEIDKILMSYDVKLTLEDAEYTIPAGVTVNLSDYDVPTKAGCVFAGWTDGVNDDVITSIAIEKDTVLKAKWVESNPEWSFDDNTTQGWLTNVDGTLTAENGALKLLLHTSNNDVFIYTQGQSIDASVYKYAVMYVKHNVPASAWGSDPFLFLFHTGNSWWSEMLVRTDRKPASDNYEKYVFDLGSNRYWSGTIPRLRFDAFDITSPSLGDYVVWIDKIMLCPEVKITFDYGLEGMQNRTVSVLGGIEANLSDYVETPVADGYRFLGWVDENGNAVTSVNSVSNVTVYASWKPTTPSIVLNETRVSVANLETSAKLVLSSYKTDGRLIDTVVVPVSSDMSMSLASSGLDTYQCREVRAFLFEDIESLVPLCKEKSVFTYMLDYEELEEGTVGLMGRWFDYEFTDGNIYTTTVTPGSEMYFKVSGTANVKIKVLDKADNWQNPPYVAVSVDGGAPTRVVTVKNAEATIVSGLDPEKEHIIRIIVDSFDSAHGGRWKSGSGGLVLDKISIDEGGTITGLMPKNPIIAYYGDSITEGLASLSSAGQGMITTSSSAINAYPFVASHLVGAVSHTSGYGSTGIKVVVGLGNVPNCITVIDNMIKDTPIVMPELDAIVINHGHNDLNANVSNADFAAGYKEVLERLREKHPGVPILAVVPYAQRYVEVIREVVEEMNDDRIYYISTADWEYTTSDGVHPDAAGAQKLGTRLASELERVFADVKAQEEN